MKFSFSTVALVAGLAAGCGTTPDERPVTFEVVALSILAPTCGQVQCHSTSTHLRNLAYDTLDAARLALQGRGVNRLKNVLRGGDDQMPPDAPLAEEDIALIDAWIAAGTPGL